MATLHAPGDIIAMRYRVTAPLGQPNTSNTYIAEDLTTEKLVAVKAISLKRMTGWKDFELLERQAQVLARMNHPAVPRYIEYFHLDVGSDRLFYLVQQLIEAKSLTHLVGQGWRADEAGARNIALQVLEILQYLHQENPPIIHRDLQPDTLLRDAEGQIFLVDFGSVKATGSSPQTYSSTLVGAYGYIPPEQFQGKAYFASDLYSLGATLLFVLTGKPPDEFPQQNMRLDFRQYLKLSSRFGSWLSKMLEPSPKARFHSASEAIASLKQPSPVSSLRQRKAPQVSARSSQFAYNKNPRPTETSRKQRPRGSQVIVRRTDGHLAIEIPSTKYCFFGTWSRLEIYPQRFVIIRGSLVSCGTYEGKTSDIIKAEFRVESNLFGETISSLLIWEGVTAHTFAAELTSVEKEWLADEISDFLGYMKLIQNLEKLIDES